MKHETHYISFSFLSSYFFLPHHVAYRILAPGPGIEPMSPVLADRFLTTGPPGKSQNKDSVLTFRASRSLRCHVPAQPHGTMTKHLLELVMYLLSVTRCSVPRFRMKSAIQGCSIILGKRHRAAQS